MQDIQLKVIYRKTADLIPYANNARTHDDAQVAQVAASIKEFGFNNPVAIDGDGMILCGHGRVLAARKLELEEVPTVCLSHLSPTQVKAYILADNKLALNAGWDNDLLKIELEDLKDSDFDLNIIGFSDDELEDILDDEKETGDGEEMVSRPLADDFIFSPFSILDSRKGEWVDRKQRWISIGLKSELGRKEELTYGQSCQSVDIYSAKNKYDAKIGHKSSWDEFVAANPDVAGKMQSGTSIFDPVLCELMIKWFSGEGATIIDPFAGGSVRGVVASKSGRRYIGVDLRKEQVEENRRQAEKICDEYLMPIWHCGDSTNIDVICKGVEADMLMTCPPYADLEVYSDDPRDLSNMNYSDFKTAYFEIIRKACSILKDNSFACCVVGEVRGKDGNFYNFVGDTIQAFLNAGMNYYNEIIPVNQIGSAAIVARSQFEKSRKIRKIHQNVLIFCKGDGKQTTQKCGKVNVAFDDDNKTEMEY